MVADDVITTTEAGEILGVQPSRVRQLILSGELKAEEGNKRSNGFDKLINRSDVLALKTKREREKKTRKRAA